MESQQDPICAPGQYLTGGSCQICTPGSVTNTLSEPGATACTGCPVGKYSAVATAACQACSGVGAGTLVDVGAASCDVCTPGRWAPASANGQHCAICEPGYMTDTLSAGGATSCSACVAGQFSAQSTVACGTCDPGSTTNTLTAAGASSCGACASGRYSSIATVACQICAPGSVTNTLSEPGATACTGCPVGKYSAVATAACQACSGVGAGTLVDVGAASCDVCTPGRWAPASANGQHCAICEPGYMTDTLSAGGATSCSACVAGQFSAQSTVACADCVCDPGYFPAGGPFSSCDCSLCEAGFVTDTLNQPHGTTCTSCAAGTWTSSSTEACQSCNALANEGAKHGRTECGECIAGSIPVSYSDGQECEPCSAGSITNTLADPGATICTPCAAGRWTQNSAEDCEVCQPGSFTNTLSDVGASQCNLCSSGQFSTDSQVACTGCVPGEYQPDVGSTDCNACGAGSQTNTLDQPGASQCSLCSSGQFSTDSQVACAGCVPGEYQPDVGSTDCNACGAGSQTNTLDQPGASSCTACEPAQYSEDAAVGCIVCSAGSITNTLADPGATICTPCAAGRWTQNSAEDCEVCQPGSFTNTLSDVGASQCNLCSSGQFSTDSQVACTGCVPGEYQPDVGSTDCNACGAGSQTNTLDQPGASQCSLCSSGQFSTDSQVACTGCVPGEYQPDVGSTDCNACGAGSQTNTLDQPGASSCTACEIGQYASATDLSCISCVTPGKGTVTVAPSSTGPSTCDPCVPGEYSVPAMPESGSLGQVCAPCYPGAATDTLTAPGGSVCEPCDPGRHSSAPTIACELCDPGSFTDTLALPGGINCTSCDVGWMNDYSTEACRPVVCDPGFWCDTIGDPHPCPGTGSERFSAPNQGVCDLCFEGWRQSSTSAECLQCVPGQYSEDAAEECDPCAVGLWGDPNLWIEGEPATDYRCQVCQPGSLTNTGEAPGSYACTACTPGKFSSNPLDRPTGPAPDTWGSYEVLPATEVVDCEQCYVGFVTDTLDQSGARNCTACPTGTDNKLEGLHNPINPCVACAPGQFTVFISNQNGTNCTECPAGSETDTASQPGGTTCTECAAGRFSPVASQECRNCPGGWYQPEIASETCLECRGTCLPSGSPSINLWDFGGRAICGVTEKAIPGATAANDFEYMSGMSMLGMYKDAYGDLTEGPFDTEQTGATLCGRCEAGFKLEFLTNQGERVDSLSLDDFPSPQMECPLALVNLTENQTGRTACQSVLDSSEVCIYSPTVSRVEETCAARSIRTCARVNVSLGDPRAEAIACQSAGLCLYTSVQNADGAVISTCNAMFEEPCAQAGSGETACRNVHSSECFYTAPVEPRNQTCVANNESDWLVNLRLSLSQNASGFKCSKCPFGQYSVPNSAECAYSCPPATYTSNEVVAATGDPNNNQYPLGMQFAQVGACVPCGHVDADTGVYDIEILDEDDNVVAELERAKFYTTAQRDTESDTGEFLDCCASPTENGFAQTSRGCIECPMMDRCVQGQCVMNSAGEACSLCEFNHYSVGARCVECPDTDPQTVMFTYATVIAATAAIIAALWQVTKVKGVGQEESAAEGQEAMESANDLKETTETIDDSARALSNTAIYSGIALGQLQVSFMTFSMPVGFPLDLAWISRYLSGIVSFDIGQLLSPECALDQSSSIVYMLFFKFLTTQVTFIGFCVVLTVLCKHGVHHTRHTINCLLAVYTLCIGTLVKSCINTVKCTNRGEKLDIYTLDMAPSVICYKGPNANPNLEVDPLFYTMFFGGVCGLVIYGILIPMYLYRRLRLGCTAAEQVARGVQGHLMSDQDVTVREGRKTDSHIIGILPADTIVQVFEKVLSPSGKVRVRIGENEWVTEKTHIKTLMCSERGIHEKNQAFQETYGWMILKYKPDRWWFEMPIIFYKIATIMATELLGGSNQNIRWLFFVMIGGALILLALVIVDKPFMDGATVHGMSGADKAECIALVSMLAGFACGIWCWERTSGCDLMSGNCDTAGGRELTPMEDTSSTFGMVMTSLAPTIYMFYEIRSQRTARRREAEAAALPETIAATKAELLDIGVKLELAKSKSGATVEGSSQSKKVKKLEDAKKSKEAELTQYEADLAVRTGPGKLDASKNDDESVRFANPLSGDADDLPDDENKGTESQPQPQDIAQNTGEGEKLSNPLSEADGSIHPTDAAENASKQISQSDSESFEQEEMSDQWLVMRDVGVRAKVNATSDKWTLQEGNVVEVDKTKNGKDGALQMRIALVVGHPGNAERVMEQCPAGWIRTDGDSGTVINQVAAAEAWEPTVVVLPDGEIHPHPKHIGRSASFNRMMDLEKKLLVAEEEQVDAELAALRKKHGTHSFADATGKERDLIEHREQLDEKEAMLRQLDELKT
eukprot:COSAG02_NODE_980_length_15492_cov_12.941727_1_plen_2373_part_10